MGSFLGQNLLQLNFKLCNPFHSPSVLPSTLNKEKFKKLCNAPVLPMAKHVNRAELLFAEETCCKVLYGSVPGTVYTYIYESGRIMRLTITIWLIS